MPSRSWVSKEIGCGSKALAHRFESPHASRRKCVVCLPAGLEALLELTLLIARHHHRELLNEQRPGA